MDKHRRKPCPRSLLIFWIISTGILLFRAGYDLKTWCFGSTIVVRSTTQYYDYLLHFPRGYHDFGKRPLIVFLHGAGEVGKDVTILKELDIFHYARNVNFLRENASRPTEGGQWEGEANRPPRLRGFPFIVISPVTPKNGWEPKRVIRFLDEFLAENQFRYNIDPERVYLTGFSMGGFGTFDVAGTYPDRFAAIVPLAGGYDPENAEKLLTVPTWAFHGDADEVVAYEQTEKIITAMQELGHPNVHFTTLHGAGHGIPKTVYTRPELYKWLLEQRKKPTTNQHIP